MKFINNVIFSLAKTSYKPISLLLYISITNPAAEQSGIVLYYVLGQGQHRPMLYERTLMGAFR